MIFVGTGNGITSYGADVPSQGFAVAAFQEQPVMRAHCPVQTQQVTLPTAVSFVFHFAKQLVNDASFPTGDEMVLINVGVSSSTFSHDPTCVAGAFSQGCSFSQYGEGGGDGFGGRFSFNWDPRVEQDTPINFINAYNELVKVVDKSITDHDVVSLCLLWMHGESDLYMNTYKEALYHMFDEFRSHFPRADSSPSTAPMPIVIGRMLASFHNVTFPDQAHVTAPSELPAEMWQ
jgi:hypothetical protein